MTASQLPIASGVSGGRTPATADHHPKLRSAQLTLFGELETERAARLKEERAFHCLDCDVDTLAIREYYVVHDELWKRANPVIEGMLCIGCLERRLGRRLQLEDFRDVAFHRGPNSKRLEMRLRRPSSGR